MPFFCRKLQCAHCRCLCVPNPRVKTQRYCSNRVCQRARKAQWQRDKLASDPDYRANQKDCQRNWQYQNPHYWRHYRRRRADYRERNRLLQQHRDQKRRLRPLAKMDASVPFDGHLFQVLSLPDHPVHQPGPVLQSDPQMQQADPGTIRQLIRDSLGADYD